MDYRRWGKTGLQVSVFSLGTMRCLASPETLYEVLQAAIALGINHLETARSYGASEVWLGQAIAAGERAGAWSRDRLVLTSKLLPTGDAAAIERQIDESLARLQVSRLDGLALHGVNTPEHLAWVQEAGGGMAGVARAIADGRVGHLGFSSHGSPAVILAAIDSGLFSFVNLHYNLFFQANQAAIARAAEQDLGVFIISPADKGGKLYQPPPKLRDLCAPIEPLELAYRWLLSDRRITTLSIGPATAAELAPIAGDRRWVEPLAATEQAALTRLEEELHRALGADRCAQCNACLPCPEAIAIPEVLRLRNLAVAYDMSDYGQYRYGMFERAGHWFAGRRGDRCTDCGDCLPRCPEGLAIPDLLRDTHDRLAGRWGRRLWDGA